MMFKKQAERDETMEIILLQDVKSLGKKGERVKVSDGYARNYVLPKKLGVEANSKNINDLKLQKAHEEKLEREALEAAKALAEKLAGKSVSIPIRTGEGGKVFGTVSSKEVAKAAKDQLDMDIDKKKLVISEPIKALGTYQVAVRLHRNVTGTLEVKVVAEK